MAITTRGGKQPVDPPMPSNENEVIKDTDKVVNVDANLEDNSAEDAEVPKKVTPMLRPPPPFPQRLLKKTEDGKYRRFITMLNFGRSFRTNSRLRQVYERSGHKEKIGHF